MGIDLPHYSREIYNSGKSLVESKLYLSINKFSWFVEIPGLISTFWEGRIVAIAADCKSAPFGVRGFESLSSHPHELMIEISFGS